MISNWLLVGTGSFLGGVLRYGLGQWVQERASSVFPFGILTVNVVGCLVIGLFFGFAGKYHWPVSWRLFFMTGLCGGFTTFSSFSLDTFQLFLRDAFIPAFANIAGSVILCLLAVWGGILLVKAL